MVVYQIRKKTDYWNISECLDEPNVSTHLTLLSMDFSLAGGLVMGLFVLTTLPWCCSLPALLCLFLLGFNVPYLRRICMNNYHGFNNVYFSQAQSRTLCLFPKTDVKVWITSACNWLFNYNKKRIKRLINVFHVFTSLKIRDAQYVNF